MYEHNIFMNNDKIIQMSQDNTMDVTFRENEDGIS